MGFVDMLASCAAAIFVASFLVVFDHDVSAHISAVIPDQSARARRVERCLVAERILAKAGLWFGLGTRHALCDPARYAVFTTACFAYFAVYRSMWSTHYVRETDYATASAVQVLGIAAAVVATVASPTTTAGALLGLSAISTIAIWRTLDGFALGAARARLATSAAAGSEGRSR